MTSRRDFLPGLQEPVVFGLVGSSGSGKTTLAIKLIAHFKAQGLKVSSIKHAHAGFDIDHPGKDSMRHREAGAQRVIISSPVRIAEIEERQIEATLEQLLARVSGADIVLVEGYKRARHPKIEVYRPENGKPSLKESEDFPNILVQVTPDSVLNLNDVPAIADKALEIAKPVSQFLCP